MVNILCLAHIHWRYSYSKTFVLKIRSLDSPPSIDQIGEILQEPTILIEAQKKASRSLTLLTSHNIKLTHYWSENYPKGLRDLEKPPWVLFYYGNLPSIEIPTIAIVGTRQPTQYGVELINYFMMNLKIRPLQIVSGLALGIDALAHSRACQLEIPNFAVLGSGPDLLYPREHVNLAHKILASGGGILSEFPPETEPMPFNFPRRNRIISALAQVIWVVQAAYKSGTIHTVRFAQELGREVAVTPGDIFCELSQFPHQLLFEGANLVRDAQDLEQLLPKRPLAI